ncbi:ferredoxin [Halonotius aquaticus]|uniref:Ferredoxin n=2 Tax=Halonotius aquaticus TaxID=2216978 RepID=A0A3A6PS12_9EURY|nr:ferredoxin [Halonotius aquaticus]
MRRAVVVATTMQTFPDSTAVSVVETPATEYTQRTVTVDFLYLDNEACERCVGTEQALETALTRIEPILEPLAVSVVVRDIHVDTLAAAKATQLAVSPTIRINGRDIQPDYRENNCESCGELCACPGEIDCRLWHYRGDEYTTPPVEFLVAALVRAAVPEQSPSDTTRKKAFEGVPANIASFFDDADASEASGCDC